MNFFKRLPIYLLLLLILLLLFWALFVPKQDFSEKIGKTLEEQKRRADMFFNMITVKEIVNGVKYWEIRARSSEMDKAPNITYMKDTYGTFFENGQPVLKMLAPTATWRMNNNEIFLTEPIGYDMKFEKNFKGRIEDLRDIKDTRSVFHLPLSSSQKDTGYWFKAHNLDWKLLNKNIACRDGITLTKGTVVVLSDRLEADLSMEHITLTGKPRASMDSVTLEATTIEVDSSYDYIYANGNVTALRPDGSISADKALFKQNENLVSFEGGVRVSYLGLSAWGDNAVYLVDEEKATIFGRAGATRGNDTLVGKEISVDFKNNKVAVKGSSTVQINEDKLKEVQ
jgi:lipopolysaccharide export system protein LptA